MIPQLMRAAWYDRQGPAHDVLQQGALTTPVAGHGEVLVSIAASGVNPHDTKNRSGWTGRPMAHARIIPHSDGAGIIAAVGAGVDPRRVGERVWIYRADQRPGHGAAAAFAVVDERSAVALPDDISFEIGAGLGVPALTAHSAVFSHGPVTGRNVLVQGGAGAVAAYAIQFARWNGARVIATVSSPEKAAVAASLGADEIIDYRREDVVARVMHLTEGRGVDRIIEVDFGDNLPADVEIIAPHGAIASYSSSRVREPVFPYYRIAPKDVRIHFVQGLAIPAAIRSEGIALITTLLSRGQLRHPQSHVFPFDRIADAHAVLESGSLIGKVIVGAPRPLD